MSARTSASTPVLSMVRRTRHGTTVRFGARTVEDLLVHHLDEVRGLPLVAVREGGEDGRLWYVAGEPPTLEATLGILRRQGLEITVLAEGPGDPGSVSAARALRSAPAA